MPPDDTFCWITFNQSPRTRWIRGLPGSFVEVIQQNVRKASAKPAKQGN